MEIPFSAYIPSFSVTGKRSARTHLIPKPKPHLQDGCPVTCTLQEGVPPSTGCTVLTFLLYYSVLSFLSVSFELLFHVCLGPSLSLALPLSVFQPLSLGRKHHEIARHPRHRAMMLPANRRRESSARMTSPAKSPPKLLLPGKKNGARRFTGNRKRDTMSRVSSAGHLGQTTHGPPSSVRGLLVHIC